MSRAGPRTTAGRGFAVKFYDILSQESSDIITWTESGQAFQVVDYTRFSEEILLKVGWLVGMVGEASYYAIGRCALQLFEKITTAFSRPRLFLVFSATFQYHHHRLLQGQQNANTPRHS